MKYVNSVDFAEWSLCQVLFSRTVFLQFFTILSDVSQTGDLCLEDDNISNAIYIVYFLGNCLLDNDD